MKTPKILALGALLGAITVSVYAATDTTTKVTLSNVHICCDNCVTGVATAIKPVTGAKATASKDEETIAIEAPDKATAQKAVDALIAAGYFGKSSNADIKVNGETGAKAGKVTDLTVSGTHLCCAKCVTAVNDSVGKVAGVKTVTAKVKDTQFKVSGDFKPTDVMAALQAEGLTGKVAATSSTK